MPLDLATLTWIAKPMTWKEAKRILERDQFRCRYCGLDGMASFENALVMGVDFVVPRARRGRKTPENLVASCRPCNVLKGRRRFSNFDEARSFVLSRREQLRNEWESRRPPQVRSASAGS
jgi:5-methylcytosine-specific restriction endonuclease McrA